LYIGNTGEEKNNNKKGFVAAKESAGKNHQSSGSQGMKEKSAGYNTVIL
jgi:hypothetical protein